MAVITIAYQIGSGGRQIGQALAKRLDLDYIDREIVQGVAQQLRVSEEVAARLDERARGLVTRMLWMLSSTGELALAAPPPDRDQQIDEGTYFKTTRAVIETSARANRSDHDRAHYIKRFYRMDWRDPAYYDLMINTAHIQPDCVVDLLVAAWQESGLGSFS